MVYVEKNIRSSRLMPTVILDLRTSPTDTMNSDARARRRFILISCLRNRWNRDGGLSSMVRNRYQH